MYGGATVTLAKRYNKLLKSRLLHYAAWNPVTDGYAVGDFGGFKGGVFQRLGNIAEFGVDPGARPGASTTKFNFTSSGAKIVRTAAGVAVDVFPEGSVEAKLEIDFSGEDGFYIRTGELSVTEMESVDAVAQQLKGRRDANGRRWQLRWRVVRKVYVAINPTILASAEQSVGFTLVGKADALKALELGSASAEISASSTRQDAVQIIGGTGPVALDLFSVRVIGGGANLEGVGAEPMIIDAELDTDWPDEPADDEDAFE